MDGDAITADDVPDSKLSAGMSLLFKTRNSSFLRQGIFPEHPCEITPAAAEKIAALKLGLVGIDWLTVEPGTGGEYPVHAVLLSNEILILESILLDTVPEGEYTLHAAPLAVTGADGAPVRALVLPPG